MRDVTTAPLPVASLLAWQHQSPAPFIFATVKNHVSTLIRIHLLEISIQVSFRPTSRHDEDQFRHDRLRWLFPVPTQGIVHATAFVAIVRRRRDRRDGKPIRRAVHDLAGEDISACTQHRQTGWPQTGRTFLDFAMADTWWFPFDGMVCLNPEHAFRFQPVSRPVAPCEHAPTRSTAAVPACP
jgi:hypothetical protein